MTIERSAHEVFRQDIPCITHGCEELTDPDHSMCRECRAGNSPAQRRHQALYGPTIVDASAKPQPEPKPLSEREIEVLSAIADGDENNEIAQRLELSKHTVISHRRRIMQKLRARNSPHAVAIAFRAGIFDR